MEISQKIPKAAWVGMVFLALVVAFAFQGSRGLYETSEGRYSECAREMIETGDFLEPTLAHVYHWTKPPLTYWAIAGGIRLLGSSEWGVRFYSALAFFFTAMMVAYIGAMLWGEATGLLAGLLYSTSPFPAFAANFVTTDTLLTLWEVGAVLCYLKALRVRSLPLQKRWIVAMWVFFGLGFLTKGPPALLPIMAILLWQFLQKSRIKLMNPLGIVLFILVGFSWYIVECIRNPGLLSYFLGTEVVDRVLSSKGRNSTWYKPFVIYLPALSLGAGTWFCYGIQTLMRKRLFDPAVLLFYLRKRGEAVFLLFWLILPLIVFFLSKSRLILYVLPLYAPMALAIARGTLGISAGMPGLRRVGIVALITGLLLVGIKGVAPLIPYRYDMKQLYTICRKVGGNDSEVMVYSDRIVYGLQYYLKGQIKRIALAGKDKRTDFTLDEAIRRIKSISKWPVVVVSDKMRASDFGRNLRGAGIPFREFEGRRWVLFFIDKRINT